jgi:hypothetical protein
MSGCLGWGASEQISWRARRYDDGNTGKKETSGRLSMAPADSILAAFRSNGNLGNPVFRAAGNNFTLFLPATRIVSVYGGLTFCLLCVRRPGPRHRSPHTPVVDFNAEACVVTVRESKAGKPRLYCKRANRMP